MADQSKDPGRDIARLALSDVRYETDLLKEVIAYAWDQLLWRQTDQELVEFRNELLMEGETGPVDPTRLLTELREARATLSITRSNILVEISRHDGHRWQGVPEALKSRIDAIDAVMPVGEA